MTQMSDTTERVYDDNVLTAINILNMALAKMSPDTRVAASKSGLIQVKSLVNMSANTLCKYSISDLLKSELLTLSSLLDTIINSTGFIETDATGKNMIVKSLRKCMAMASMFACEFYTTHDFHEREGLIPLCIDIVKIGIANNFDFNIKEEVQ